MSTRGTCITLKFRSVLDVVHATRFQSSHGGIKRIRPIVSATRVEGGCWMHPSLQLSTSSKENGVKNKVEQGSPASTSFTFFNWLRWVLGTVLSLLLPFWKHNWEKLRRLEGEAEEVVEEVEKVAQVVEKVATMAEKVSEDIAETLPEDGKLKNVALVLENASKQAAHDAQLTQQFIHKVEELKNDVDDLETFVEPVIDKIVKKEAVKN